MSDDVVEQLKAGCCMHKKYWSGDVHGDKAYGPLDEAATNALMVRAADEIRRLNTVVAELRHQADCFYHEHYTGQTARNKCEECRTLWEAVEATRETLETKS